MKEKLKDLKHLFQREFNPAETHFVLRHPAQIYFTWGVESVTFIDSYGLLLKVNGNHHKDFVLITLDWSDTFTVSLLDKDFKLLKSQTLVYVDELNHKVDRMIEYIPDYKF